MTPALSPIGQVPDVWKPAPVHQPRSRLVLETSYCQPPTEIPALGRDVGKRWRAEDEIKRRDTRNACGYG
jgi:hypothetical protein